MQWHGREAELEAELRAHGQDSRVVQGYTEALKLGDPSVAACLMGEGVDLVESIDSAEAVVQRVAGEAQETIARLAKLVP